MSLYVAHRRRLLAYARGISGGDAAQAEDVVQEAFLRFNEAALGRFLEEPIGFLYRIVRNLALDGRRRATHESHYSAPAANDTMEMVADAQPSPEIEALHRQELAMVRTALAELPERTRIAVELHRLEGCKLREIAERLNISVGLAHSLVADGIEHCRQRLRRD